MSTDGSRTEAWKSIALGEQAAVYAYGVLTAQFPDGPERSRAIDLGVTHAHDRDRARAALAEQSVEPDSPAAFEIPFPMTGPASARRLAAVVESRLVDVYCAAVGQLEGKERRRAAASAAACSARSVRWGARPTAFPGEAEVELVASATPDPTGSAASGSVSPDDGASVG